MLDIEKWPLSAHIAGALVVTAGVFGVSNLVGNLLFPQPAMPVSQAASGKAAPSSKPAKPKTRAKAQAKAVNAPLSVRLASANAERGKKLAKKCSACHTFEEGGKKKTGPNLWSVVGRSMGATSDFKYSEGFKGLSGAWTFEALDEFVANPKTFAPGNKMAFKGLKSGQERADLLVYLNGFSAVVQPLPQPTPQELALAQEAGENAVDEVVEVLPDPAVVFATVAGMRPSERPSWAPKVTQPVMKDGWLANATRGIPDQVAVDLKFIADQGSWYTPFNRAGMPSPYDIRSLHTN